MPPLSLIMIACATIGLHVASAYAGTCSDGIAQLEALDQLMATLPQSIGAQLHHQPTRDSVRRAEEIARALPSILARAQILNTAGKTTECIQFVAEAKRLLSIN
jgi:hypothetical protein